LLEWGKIRALAERTLPVADTLIAAAAIVHHMFLVTRNTKDFEDIEGINLINPWGAI
jgi:toxin FitB